MQFPNYTVWIFAIIMILLAMIAFFPSNLTIGLAVVLSSVLIILQAILILKDTELP